MLLGKIRVDNGKICQCFLWQQHWNRFGGFVKVIIGGSVLFSRVDLVQNLEHLISKKLAAPFSFEKLTTAFSFKNLVAAFNFEKN